VRILPCVAAAVPASTRAPRLKRAWSRDDSASLWPAARVRDRAARELSRAVEASATRGERYLYSAKLDWLRARHAR